MQFSVLFITAALAASAQACTECPHPGTFTNASLGFYFPVDPNFCETPITESDIAVSLPAIYWDPPDESPCDETVNVTNVATGVTIAALIVGECTTCVGNDILITTAGQAALAPDADPNHAPGTVTWTFNN